ncbi:MAG: ATP synthase F1 subunit delta [Patescibacteria group bacterium]
MKKSNKQYAKALYEVSKDAPKNHLDEVAKQFLSLLLKDRKLKKIEYIIDEFERYSKNQDGIKEVEVESAGELSKITLSKIKKTFGDNAEIKETTNPNLIGGIRIKVDNIVYDASLKKQLSRLKNQLI